MARHYGVAVKAFNISREQIAYARARADREGLGGRIDFIEDDYRNVSGTFDAFVSVGMLEHVACGIFNRSPRCCSASSAARADVDCCISLVATCRARSTRGSAGVSSPVPTHRRWRK